MRIKTTHIHVDSHRKCNSFTWHYARNTLMYSTFRYKNIKFSEWYNPGYVYRLNTRTGLEIRERWYKTTSGVKYVEKKQAESLFFNGIPCFKWEYSDEFLPSQINIPRKRYSCT